MAPRIPPTAEQRNLDGALWTFDIPTLLTQIKSEDAWQKGKRNATTLLEGHGLRVVLIAMHSGTLIKQHQTINPISLQVIEGRIKFNTHTNSVTLTKGQLLTLHPEIPHDLEALEESAFLLTLATHQSDPEENSISREGVLIDS
jgi:quercetin dioxygenase-like cupin family protein